MYCTVKFCKKLTNEEYEKLLILFNGKNNFNYKKCNNYLNGFSFNYSHENLIFSLTEKSLTGFGSLTKFYFGDNIRNASFEEIQTALIDIEKSLEISLANAVIKRLDVGFTLRVNEQPSKYMQMMSTPIDCKRTLIGEFETVYFRSTKVDFSLYDKNLEALSRKRYKEYFKKGDYKLRYEVRIKKLSDIVNGNEFTWNDLSQKEVYLRLADSWYNYYHSIPIAFKESILDIDFTNLKELKYNLELHGIMKFGGVDTFRQALNVAHIDKSTRFRTNEFLNKIKLPVYDKNHLQSELNKKVLEAYLVAKS